MPGDAIWPLLATFVPLLACVTDGKRDEGPAPVCSSEASTEVYERRIAPLLVDDRPSTCNECHLSGVDLSLYVRKNPCKTMACMVEQGVVDLDSPADSVLLSWILRAQPAGLITEDTITSEHDGMLEWIEYMSSCGADVCETFERPCGMLPDQYDCDLDQPDGPSTYEDPGDCSDVSIERLWYEKIYPWRARCYPCHFDTFTSTEDEYEGAPKWIATGDCEIGSLMSLHNVEALGLINIEDPLSSPLLLKPLHEDVGGVPHVGHHKIDSTDEATYIDFVAFLERYAQCHAGS